ncbi:MULTISPECIES: hypothetical protein [Bradyrhizobium]|uniref:Ribulose kinase n=1 Tax=Bradyrhizobium ottawaense TaxID=931866 RepID=A0ABV4FHL1_9BRAD|nr:hypothetical protein [Bradyrhizobium sp. CCBAU 15615]
MLHAPVSTVWASSRTISIAVISKTRSPELAEQAHQASCGFAITIEPDLLRAARTLEARLANLGTPVGQLVDLEGEYANRADLRKTCQLFQGWIDCDSAHFLVAIVDGEEVAQVNATARTHVREAAAHRNACAFDFHVPQRFADGRVHRVSLRKEDGEPIQRRPSLSPFPTALPE